jgi:hypothetical protein
MKRFMRKWVWMMAMLPGLLMAIDCPAAYRIELKNGTSIVTGYYWEENGQIKYHHYGGVVGVAKDLVMSITDTDAPVPQKIVSDPSPTPVPRPAAEPASSKAAIEDPEEFEKKMAKSHEDMQRNHSEATFYSQQYRMAREQNDQEAMAEAWKKLEELQAEQTRLRQELRDRLDGDLPEWWDEVISQ